VSGAGGGSASAGRGGTSILEARDVKKSYGSGESYFEALKGVSLTVRGGESVAITGKSGSGKSTLMHLLALLDTPDGGSVLVDGTDAGTLGKGALNELRNRRFGFVFQQFFMIPNASVLDNVVLPLKIGGMPRGKRVARGMEVLRQVELADNLANSPAVIFADEPTGNLDSATGAVVEDLLFELNRERGITLVIVTHDEDLAARCDRRVQLRDGRVER